MTVVTIWEAQGRPVRMTIGQGPVIGIAAPLRTTGPGLSDGYDAARTRASARDHHAMTSIRGALLHRERQVVKRGPAMRAESLFEPLDAEIIWHGLYGRRRLRARTEKLTQDCHRKPSAPKGA